MLTLIFVVAAFAQTSQPVSVPTSQPARLRTLEVTAIVTEEWLDEAPESIFSEVSGGNINLIQAMRDTYKLRRFHRTLKIDFEKKLALQISKDLVDRNNLAKKYGLAENEMVHVDHTRSQLASVNGSGVIWIPGIPTSIAPVNKGFSWVVNSARLGIVPQEYRKFLNIPETGWLESYSSEDGVLSIKLHPKLGTLLEFKDGVAYRVETSNFKPVDGGRFHFPWRVIDQVAFCRSTIDYQEFRVNPVFPRETFSIPRGMHMVGVRPSTRTGRSSPHTHVHDHVVPATSKPANK